MLLFVILFFLAGVFMLRLVYANEKQQMHTQYKKLCLGILEAATLKIFKNIEP